MEPPQVVPSCQKEPWGVPLKCGFDAKASLPAPTLFLPRPKCGCHGTLGSIGLYLTVPQSSHPEGNEASKGQVWTCHLAPAARAFHSLHSQFSSIAVFGAFARPMPMCWSPTSLNRARGCPAGVGFWALAPSFAVTWAVFGSWRTCDVPCWLSPCIWHARCCPEGGAGGGGGKPRIMGRVGGGGLAVMVAGHFSVFLLLHK